MKNSELSFWSFLAHYIGPRWPQALALTALVIANTALLLVNPQIVRFFIDAAQAASPLEHLIQAGIWFIVLAVIQQMVSVAAIYTSENIGWATTNVLRADLVDHCLRLDMIFHNQHTPGEMIERIDGDVTTLSNLFSQFIIQIVSNALLLVGILVLLFVEDWRAGGAMTLFTLVNMAAIGKLRNIAVPHWKGERQASADLYGYIEERLSGMEDIRANAGKPYILRHFYRLARVVRQRAIQAAVMTNAMVNTTFILFSIGVAISMSLSAYLLATSSITLGGAYMVFYYTNLLRMPIDRIMQQMQDLQRGSASLARIQDLLAARPRIHEAPVVEGSPVLLEPGAVGVSFQEVSFAYHDEALPAVESTAQSG
jgi:ATP-binding cassette, subfamily B, bacterial